MIIMEEHKKQMDVFHSHALYIVLFPGGSYKSNPRAKDSHQGNSLDTAIRGLAKVMLKVRTHF